MSPRETYLAGERPDDVAIYLSEAGLRNADALAERAEAVEGGYLLVLPGDRAREVFSVICGEPPMEFAQEASEREGPIDRGLTGGDCPEAPGGGEGAGANEAGEEAGDHGVRFLLSFVQEQTEDAGGPYEEGDVVHAYAKCDCGVAYSDRWVVGKRTDG